MRSQTETPGRITNLSIAYEQLAHWACGATRACSSSRPTSLYYASSLALSGFSSFRSTTIPEEHTYPKTPYYQARCIRTLVAAIRMSSARISTRRTSWLAGETSSTFSKDYISWWSLEDVGTMLTYMYSIQGQRQTRIYRKRPRSESRPPELHLHFRRQHHFRSEHLRDPPSPARRRHWSYCSGGRLEERQGGAQQERRAPRPHPRPLLQALVALVQGHHLPFHTRQHRGPPGLGRRLPWRPRLVARRQLASQERCPTGRHCAGLLPRGPLQERAYRVRWSQRPAAQLGLDQLGQPCCRRPDGHGRCDPGDVEAQHQLPRPVTDHVARYAEAGAGAGERPAQQFHPIPCGRGDVAAVRRRVAGRDGHRKGHRGHF